MKRKTAPSISRMFERRTLTKKLEDYGVNNINEALQIAYIAAQLGITTKDYENFRNEKEIKFKLERKNSE